MNSLSYVKLLAEGPRVHFNAFRDTNDPHHAAQFLASIGHLRRLKPEYQSAITAAMRDAEEILAEIGSKSLHAAANGLDFTTITEMLELVESTSPAHLQNKDQRFETRLACDEFIDERDQIHLAFTALEQLGITIPNEKTAFLQMIDERARRNATLRGAMTTPRSYSNIFDPQSLSDLWWWQQQAPTAGPLPTTQGLLSRFKEWFWPPETGYIRRLAPFAAAAANAVIVVLYAPPPKPDSTAISIRDGSRNISLDKEGTLSGLDGLPPQLSADLVAVLKRPADFRPSVDKLRPLNPAAGSTVQMGTDPSMPFSLIAPIGRVVDSDQPSFSWDSLPGATSYTVSVFEYGGGEVAKSAPLQSAIWNMGNSSVSSGDGALPRGKTYLWLVTAVVDDKQIVSTRSRGKPALFSILSAMDSEELQRAKLTNSHLLLGLLYTRLGMLDAAVEEFEALTKDNPNAPVVETLLRAIENAKKQLGQ